MGGKAPPTKHARVRCREGEQAPHAPHVQVGAEKTRGQPQAWALEILPLNTQDETEITAVTCGARRGGRSRAELTSSNHHHRYSHLRLTQLALLEKEFAAL